MLTNRKTQLRFDNFTLGPIDIASGTTQGCPLSMLLYAFYNMDLINIMKGKLELSTGFVDDCTFVVIADDLDSAHATLKNMMEDTDRGLEWSHSHNSPFELSKLAVMDFARTSHDTATPPLRINKPNPNNTFTTYTISTVDNYKYLGVIFDPKLKWRAHVTKQSLVHHGGYTNSEESSKPLGDSHPVKPASSSTPLQCLILPMPLMFSTPPHSSSHTAETPKDQSGPPNCYNQFKEEQQDI